MCQIYNDYISLQKLPTASTLSKTGLMKKIVIAPDSFKGSLTSLQVAQAIEEGIHMTLPSVHVIKIPVADGGEGTMHTLVDALHGIYTTCKVYNPLMREITAKYGILKNSDSYTAIIDMASASGLTLLTEKGEKSTYNKHLWDRTTYRRCLCPRVSAFYYRNRRQCN